LSSTIQSGLKPSWAAADHADTHRRNTAMQMKLSIAFTLFALMGAVPLLGACHTTAGAGQDISATGQVLTNSAQKNTP